MSLSTLKEIINAHVLLMGYNSFRTDLIFPGIHMKITFENKFSNIKDLNDQSFI